MPNAKRINVGGVLYDIVGKGIDPGKNIDGVKFTDSKGVSHYGVCSTPSGDANKTAQIDSFALGAGARVSIKFTNANSAEAITLNVSNTGAMDVIQKGEEEVSGKAWSDGEVVNFVFDGVRWNLIGGEGNGGSRPKAISNDVDFIDYDGEILYSYSASDFANLTEMPENPEHKGLISRGWNWELADAKAYVAKYGRLDIGQTYITNDGKTRLYISIRDPLYASLSLNFCQTKSDGVVIDWGDESPTETFSGTGQITTQLHNYSLGNYVITLLQDEDCQLSLGYNQPPQTTFNIFHTEDSANATMATLTAVEVGENVTFEHDCFRSCGALETIVIPDGIVSIPTNLCYSCRTLKAVVLPTTAIDLTNSSFYQTSIKKISMPNGVNWIPYDFVGYTYLTRYTCPEPTDSPYLQNCFFNLIYLSRADIPENIVSLAFTTFYGCYSVKEVHFYSLTPPPGKREGV